MKQNKTLQTMHFNDDNYSSSIKCGKTKKKQSHAAHQLNQRYEFGYSVSAPLFTYFVVYYAFYVNDKCNSNVQANRNHNYLCVSNNIMKCYNIIMIKTHQKENTENVSPSDTKNRKPTTK